MTRRDRSSGRIPSPLGAWRSSNVMKLSTTSLMSEREPSGFPNGVCGSWEGIPALLVVDPVGIMGREFRSVNPPAFRTNAQALDGLDLLFRLRLVQRPGRWPRHRVNALTPPARSHLVRENLRIRLPVMAQFFAFHCRDDRSVGPNCQSTGRSMLCVR